MPEHADAAPLDLGRPGVLRMVDEVAVHVLGRHHLRLGLHPGRDEGGEVAGRIAVQRHLLADQLVDVARTHPPFRELLAGDALDEEAGAVVGGKI